MRLSSQVMVVVFAALAGCSGDDGRTSESATVPRTAPPSALATPAASAATTSTTLESSSTTEYRGEILLTLHVTNQSFEDDPVDITVTIDGSVVVDNSFFVGSQHTWVTFDLALSPGEHELEARSNTGASMIRTVVLTDDGQRWALLSYMYGGGSSRDFSFRIADEPMNID